MNAYANKNTGKLQVAVLAMAMVIACGVVVFSDSDVDAANDSQSYSGTLDGEQVLNNNVVIDKELKVTAGGVLIVKGDLTIDADVTVEKGGQIIVIGNGTDDPLVTINGNVEVTGNGKVITINDTDAKSAYAIVNAEPYVDGDNVPSAFIIKNDGATDSGIETFKDDGIVINGSVLVEKGAAFIGTNTESLLIKNDGSLEIDGDKTHIDKITVYIAVGGEFTLAGQVGTTGMTVSSYGTGSAFTLASANIKATAGVTKTDTKTVSELTFTVTSKNVNGYVASAEPEPTLIREYALNIEGSVANLDILTLTGSLYKSQTSNGTTTYIEDTTSVYYTSEDAAKHAQAVSGNDTKSVAYNDLIIGKVIIGNMTAEKTGSIVFGTSDDKVYVIVAGTVNVKETTVKDQKDAGVSSVNGSDDDIVSLITIGKDSVIEITGTVTANYSSISNVTGVDNLGIIAINGGNMTVDDFDDSVKSAFYGAYYIDKDETAYFSDLATAIAGAQAGGSDEVYVYAATNSENDADGYGGYVLTADITIPADLELIINNALIVDEGVTMTIAVDSKIDISDFGKIFVLGTIVDNEIALEDFENDDQMYFQVKLVDEDAEVNTYTTLANALATATSGTIYLYNNVTIDGTVTIPENVTVQFATGTDGKKIDFEDTDATLVINGTLYLDATNRLDMTTVAGNVTVNSILAFDGQQTVTPGASGTGTFPTIYGVYYSADLIGDDDVDESVITSAAIAAENSVYVNGTMTVYGKVAMGTVTFTQGEDYQLIIAILNGYNGGVVTGGTAVDKNVVTGDVTLVGAKFDMSAGAYTGTVTSETSAGSTVVTFDKSKGVIIGFDVEEAVDGTVTTDMTLTAKVDILGGVEITSGEATIDSDMRFSSTDDIVGTLSIATGAILNINANVKLGSPNIMPSDLTTFDDSLSEFIAENKTIDVAGTVNVNQKGTIQYGYAVITGTVNVLKGGQANLTLVQNDGTISVSEDAGTVSMEIMVVSGTLSGDFEIGIIDSTAANYGAIIVLPGADMTNGRIMWDDTNNETTAAVSELYINDDLYGTVYANGDMPVYIIAQTADVEGVYKTGNDVKYYSDATLDTTVDKEDPIGKSSAYYVVMKAQMVDGTVSQGTGLTLFIDDIAFVPTSSTAPNYQLSVGTHTVRIDVRSGYDGSNATITFNGQTIENGGTIDITVDMIKTGFNIVASGAVPAQNVIETGSSDDGMGLTDYLLIILVVLIVIMAIMVAMRLMRS